MGDIKQPRILCVDDEPRVLEGLESNLAWHYDVQVATSGAAGLEAIRDEGPFAVVMSDMRMPGMDGATFLGKVRLAAPDTVRILLTGYSDIDVAIEAVNKGNIFRFLNKPCEPDVLLAAVEAAVEQHRMIFAERELLENTLGGVIKVLTDVLSLTAPVAFSCSSSVKSYVHHMVKELAIVDAWQYELAAMLSQIGCITIPPNTLDKAYAGQALTDSEAEMLKQHPIVGRDLLTHVPRLELVAEMIACQHEDISRDIQTKPQTPQEKIQLGAQLLKLALDVDRQVASGADVKSVVAKLQRKKKTGHSPTLLAALAAYSAGPRNEIVRAVRVRDLQTSMILDEDVCLVNGSFVVGRGREVTRALIERLKNFADGVGIVEPIRVRVLSG